MSSAREGPLRPPVCDFVEEEAAPGHTYLVPLGFRGFRLETGEPIFVDWKSHPYRDDEFVEWFKRVKLTSEFYSTDSAAAALWALNQIRRESQITHVIAYGSTRQALGETELQQVYEGPDYAVFATGGESVE